MSSTRIDFSSYMIDRQQDIASWPEGDIDQLNVGEKDRYQKRKSAIVDYFQTDLPSAEIAAVHRFSSADELEVLAKHCCLPHEDGRPWGFRALVPGVIASEREDEEAVARFTPVPISEQEIPSTSVPVLPEEIQGTDQEKADTDEHQAVMDDEVSELPGTPLPVSASSPGEQIAPSPDLAEDEELADELVEQMEFPTLLEGAGEIEQEEFPLLAEDSGVNMEEKQEDEEAEETAGQEEEHILADELIEQEKSPVLAEDTGEIAEGEQEEEEAEEAAGQEEEHSVADEMVEQEEFPVIPRDREAITEEQEEAEDSIKQDEGEVITDELVKREDSLIEQNAQGTTADEKVEENNFSVSGNETGIQEARAEISAFSEIDEDEDDEPTDKRRAVKPQTPAIQEESEPGSGGESAATEARRDTQTGEVEERASAWDEFAEQDTVEVASVARERYRDRVAAVETIKVPAALLDALEAADRELASRSAESGASPGEDQTKQEDAERAEKEQDFALAAPPALYQLEEEQPAAADSEALSTAEVAGLPTRELEIRRRDSRQHAQAPVSRAPIEESRFRITGKQSALRHGVLRRWNKQGHARKYQRWVRVVSAAVIASILIILLIPLSVGLVGYNAYTNIKGVADDGVNNLLSLKALVPANKNDFLAVLNPQKLATAKTNLQKAQSDFLQLEDMVNRPDIESLLHQFAPQYSSKLDMARRLVQVGLDVSRMGQELIGVAQMGANIVHTPGLLSSSSQKPLLSADDVNMVQAALVHAQYYINDIQGQMSQVNLAEVPFGSATEKAQLAKYLQQIPQAQDLLAQAQTLVGPVAWMLGIGQTRHFLVQTLDRGELRPSGGFEGQYGILTLQNGRMAPFSLRDITLLDYAENGAELGATPPPQYGWMNFGNFGVRDANLSADFPTTAQIVMRYFQQEGGGPVDGVLQFTPVVIEQFLQMTGPLKIAEYHDTVTAQNLEDKLHQYQQDPRLIALQQQVTGQDGKATRKAFTSLVGSLLMDRIKKLPPSELLSFGKILLKDLKTRDLQVYLNNPVAEQWLTEHGDSGAMPQFTHGMDGFMVVQANISISKAAQYVKSTFRDQVTLDAQGGATHNLTITLNYQQTGPVYGFNTYADYLRVYAPADAHLLNAYGFNTGATLCVPGKPPSKPTNGQGGNGTGTGTGTPPPVNTGGSYTDAGILITGCGQYYHTFTDTNARNCPDGNYQLGYDGMMAKPWPVQSLGGPSAQTSDLPGYSMWGGLTLTPKNCISTITLSWYVPHVVQNTAGKSPYQMIVGHQAGWPDTADISIDASALKGVKSLKYNQVINEDTLVALPALPLPPAPQKPSSPTPAVTPTATERKP